jgi:hypothetical protein
MTFDAARIQAQENAVRYGYPWMVRRELSRRHGGVACSIFHLSSASCLDRARPLAFVRPRARYVR